VNTGASDAKENLEGPQNHIKEGALRVKWGKDWADSGLSGGEGPLGKVSDGGSKRGATR